MCVFSQFFFLSVFLTNSITIQGLLFKGTQLTCPLNDGGGVLGVALPDVALAEEHGAEGLRAHGALGVPGHRVGHHVAGQGPIRVEAGLADTAAVVTFVAVALEVHLERGGGHEVTLTLGALVRLGPCNRPAHLSATRSGEL